MRLSRVNETTSRIRVEENYYAQHRNGGDNYHAIRINHQEVMNPAFAFLFSPLDPLRAGVRYQDPTINAGRDIIPGPLSLFVGWVEKAI